MNLIKTLILSTLLVAFAFAGEAATKLPTSAQAVLDKCENAVAANRAAYDKANVKPLADAEKALKAEMEKQTKAGKLNEALAIQKALEGLRDSVVASVDEKAKEKGDLLGDTKDIKSLIVGTWNITYSNAHTETITVDANLNVTVSISTWNSVAFTLKPVKNKLVTSRGGVEQTYFLENSGIKVNHGVAVRGSLVKN
jgi:hypothetical protein